MTFSFLCFPFAIGLFWSCLLQSSSSFFAKAWVSPSLSSQLSLNSQLSLGCLKKSKCTALYYSSEFDRNNNEISNSTAFSSSSSVVERLRINGVSISPKGFHVLLESTSTTTESTSTTTKSSRKMDSDATTTTTTIEEATNDDDKTKKTTNVKKNVLPLKMTNDPADAFAATSPESLTLCQLLSGVDMAGAILPPELLGKIVSCHIEDKIESLYDDDDDDDDEQQQQQQQENKTPSVFTPVLSPIEMKIWEYLQNQEAMMREQQLFSSQQQEEQPKQHHRAQMNMPQVTLDQLTLVPLLSDVDNNNNSEASWQCKLECALPEWKENIVVDVKADLLASLAYNYDPEASPLFTCVALALRYKAPIVLYTKQDGDDDNNDDKTPQQQQRRLRQVWSTFDDLDRDFPQRTTLENLQEQSNRVTQNIEQGFEIHKLTGALQIAMRLGDHKAAEKIRAKLDEYDSMEDLPTIPSSRDSDDDNNNNNHDNDNASNDRRLDDLENNMFQ